MDDYNIISGDVLHLILRLRGGMYHQSSGREDMDMVPPPSTYPGFPPSAYPTFPFPSFPPRSLFSSSSTTTSSFLEDRLNSMNKSDLVTLVVQLLRGRVQHSSSDDEDEEEDEDEEGDDEELPLETSSEDDESDEEEDEDEEGEKKSKNKKKNMKKGEKKHDESDDEEHAGPRRSQQVPGRRILVAKRTFAK
eukprot:TRINITY_DN10438_c0_g1_i4.p1 TRINITY_DN10438_c0_g1~~TRINITY_DN10438_c0_g1_i4.p1  ORF type:complete len:192 (+),score=61.57 TRINITY_DN10438_c0_g1_i4:405-980(+)